ncbi:hypothetical protein [Mucilaginibacter ginsenosidivorans]|uniref:DUF2157 domain-containing protein n=1 Tax=Mucilaginibacter ginsenosidivorans TaxID=398053 RepID=A0A5B8USX5_9SPHI|nr:hypothetical protein [Mucilaginibacter ginsenosidivorans]QEC61546.1 hypothetical protein FRZ54_02745 [Mucilaginibacter ginsenosidivorans]
MIAYNTKWLANLRLKDMLKKDEAAGRITEGELKAIMEQYPAGFYTPGALARAGFFIITCVVVLFAYGLISLMAASADIFDSPAFPIFLGMVSYVGLELMVYVKHHYRSGVDDALLFLSACMILAGLFMAFSGFGDRANYATLCGIAFLMFLILSLRFIDILMAAACSFCLFAFIFFTWTSLIASGLTTAPFIMMLVAGGGYWLSYTSMSKFVDHENCFTVAQIVCLVTLYAAGNYYIIKTLSDNLHGQPFNVPFGTFFWAWTIGIPLVYIGFGIRKKNIILLRTGLLMIVPAVLTFRNYYHILPTDIMLTIAGAVLLGLAYGIIRYLKTPRHGFTYAAPEDEHMADRLKVESLLVAESFSSHTPAPADNSVKFGGGDFGGGGSSGNF